jgi:signal transduction histidine kinase
VVILFSKSSISILIIIAAVAIALAVISYQYTSATADSIASIATNDARSNADIEARALSNVLMNKMEQITSNLQILSNATTIQAQDVTGAKPLFTSARLTSSDFASSYFWIDRNGKLLWADAFTNKTLEQQYNGDDRSYRPYYSYPRDTLKPYFSTIIESVDSVPRLYVAYPIIDHAQPTPRASFKGVVVAAVNIDVLGKFVQSQLSPKYHSTAGIMDKNGLLLYSTNATYVGKNIFGPEVQSILPLQIKDPFNNFIRDSLKGQHGSGDITYQGKTSTIAYQPVSVKENDFAILYITTPHELAVSVNSLIDQQRTFNALLILVIGAIAIGIAILVLIWNKRLTAQVAMRTLELNTSNKSLGELNSQLSNSNEQLRKANEQLLVNDKMQREFINIAAHELRTPTQAIIGYSDLFEMDPGGRDEAMKAVARNASRLERLTSDILDVTKIEGKSLTLNKEKFNIAEVINSAVNDAKSRLVNGGRSEIKFLYDNTEDISVYADRARINQVISNLIGNAVKFTHKGIISITTKKIKNENKVDEVIVSLKDTGSGIDPDILPRLFTKFTSRSQTGTGLGLFISKNIVEAHGGTIQGRNNGDGEKGATFTFTLPLGSMPNSL